MGEWLAKGVGRQVLPAGSTLASREIGRECGQADGDDDLGLVSLGRLARGGDSTAHDRQQCIRPPPRRGALVQRTLRSLDRGREGSDRCVDDRCTLGIQDQLVARHPAPVGVLGQRAGRLLSLVLITQVLVRAQHPRGHRDRRGQLLVVQTRHSHPSPALRTGEDLVIAGVTEQDPQIVCEQVRVGDPAHALLEPHELIGLAQRQATVGEGGDHVAHASRRAGRGLLARVGVWGRVRVAQATPGAQARLGHPHHRPHVPHRRARCSASFVDTDPVPHRPRLLGRQAPGDPLTHGRDLSALGPLTDLPHQGEHLTDVAVGDLPYRRDVTTHQRAQRIPQPREQPGIRVTHRRL